MNKLVQKAACIALLAALMGGCSMNDKKDANTKTNETKEAAEKSVKKALLHRKQYRQKNRRKRLKGEMEKQ